MLRRFLRISALATTVLTVSPAPVAGDPVPAPRKVLVLLSQNAGPYQEAVSGLTSQLGKARFGAAVETHVVGRGVHLADAAVVVAVGAAALREATENSGGAPVVGCMVLAGAELRAAQNVTGVHLEIPVDTELEWLRKILPQARNIGVVYHSDENHERLARAQASAAKLGLTLHTRRVQGPNGIPAALESLETTADAIWGVADPVVLSPETAKPILLFSMRNRLPFVGLSLAWAKAGALYALDRDYEDVGRQCGEAVERLLRREAVGSIPIAAPRRVVYALNRRTADHMKIVFAPALLREAKEVVQ